MHVWYRVYRQMTYGWEINKYIIYKLVDSYSIKIWVIMLLWSRFSHNWHSIDSDDLKDLANIFVFKALKIWIRFYMHVN